MNANDIIRAWTDATFRKSLKAQGIEVPAHPAGNCIFSNEDALSDADLDSGIAGGVPEPRRTNFLIPWIRWDGKPDRLTEAE